MAQIQAIKTEKGGYVTFSDYGENDRAPISTTLDLSNMNGTKMSKEEAESTGRTFLEKLGLTGYDVALELGGYMPPTEETNDEIAHELNSMRKCYIFYYTQSVCGVGTTYRDSSQDGMLGNPYMMNKINNSVQYAPFWPQESIELIITDSGVISMDWTMPTIQTEVLNENVALLPFDEIKEKFKSQMMIEGLWTAPNDDSIIGRKITINRIELGMMQMREKDTNDGLIMVSAWNFYGYETYKYAEQEEGGYILNDQNEYTNDQLEGHSFLTINAIDGNVINPIIGY